MIRLLEDQTKAWLQEAGIPVPRGASAHAPEGAGRIAESLGGEAVIKALVPTGRRGKAGAVRRVAGATAARIAANELLGRTLSGYVAHEVYVEEAIAIARELYCAFLFDENGPRIVLSGHGGVDIEAAAHCSRHDLTSYPITPMVGMPPWLAIDLWYEAGLRGAVLRELGDVTTRLYEAFVGGDAELLEINPLTIDIDNRIVIVGAMAGIDSSAISRQLQWDDVDQRVHTTARPSPREMRVRAIDAEVPGPECRYIELDGDIGLLVGGGGAGLYQHDRILALGAHPANHSVTPPTGSDNRKLRTVIEAILDHPGVRGLLVGFNFTQMARADIRVRTLVDVLDARGIDTSRFPIVIRLFGAGEDEARACVADRDGIHYLPREATLDDAVRLIVRLTRDAATATVS